MLRRLRGRPLVPVPSPSEPEAELFARVDRPGHAAVLGEDQYALILRSGRVAWKSVLAFITQEPDGSSTRAFWIDPLRRTCLGCLLDEGDIEALSPFFGPDRGPTRTPPAEIDVGGFVRRVDVLEVGRRFFLPDGTIGEVAERFAADMGSVSIWLDPDSERPTSSLLGPATPVYPVEEEPREPSPRPARNRGKLEARPARGALIQPPCTFSSGF